MPQTLLAFIGLMFALQLSLSQQRTIISSQMNMVDSEIETIASGVGLEILDHIGKKPFDAATVSENVESASAFTALPFATGGTFSQATDIDDFNDIVTHSYATGFSNLSFELDIEVRYVEESDLNQVATAQTFVKEVVVTLNHAQMTQPIQLNRVYSYP